MNISANVVADSVHDRSRLTTFEVTFPRFILAEFNTHRMLSRNSASSRAIPVWKRLSDIVLYPFIPLQFGKNKAGMQSAEDISQEDTDAACTNWLVGRDVAVIQAFMLAGGENQIMKDSKGDVRAVTVCDAVKQLMAQYSDVVGKMIPLNAGVHKQHANRVLEPYAWHTVIVTGTHWRNFYGLRASTMAQPEIDSVAIEMARAHSASIPEVLEHGEWHLPYVFPEDKQEIENNKTLARISSARCARVSYLTHDGKRSIDADLKMVDGLQSNGHVSPFEHPATTHDTTGAYFGNFNGNFSPKWMQYRKMLENEHDFTKLTPTDSLLLGMKGDQKLVDFVLSLPD
ncbi:MAG TPA: FAD-dependent thymidylate synthase [Candidatus Paceibacterota bacterium]